VHNRLREYKRLKVTSTSTSTENDALVTEFNEYITFDSLPDPQCAGGSFNADIPPLDCLQWWYNRRKQWPNLSRIAFDSLTVPLISDNPERSFSSGRDMITYRRSQLASDIIEACAFLRSAYGPLSKDRSGSIPVPAFVNVDEVEVDRNINSSSSSRLSTYLCQ
jgi:hypothetical protein